MHEDLEARTTPRLLAVVVVQLLALSLVISLLVRAIADGWAITNGALQVGLAAVVLAGIVLYRRRRGERLSIGGSSVAKVVFGAVVIGPAVFFVGVATGFVLDATSIRVALVVALAGLAIEAGARGLMRRQGGRDRR